MPLCKTDNKCSVFGEFGLLGFVLFCLEGELVVWGFVVCVCLLVSIKHKQLLPPYRFALRFHINNFGFC